MEITVTDISKKKEFAFDGTKLIQMEYCESTGRYLYKRLFPNGRIFGWEVVQPNKVKNPTGEYVYTYPSTTQFGKYAWFLPPKVERTKIDYYLQGKNKEMTYVEYLKSIKK